MKVFLILVLLAGGGGYFSEQALPGDLLYPVKVTITEPVRGAFAFSGEDRAFWAAQRVNRRFQEVSRLIATNEFVLEMWNGLEPDIINQIAEANEWAKKFQDWRRYAVAADTSYNLETVLLFYEQLVPTFTRAPNETNLEGLVAFIKKEREQITVVRESVEKIFLTETIGLDAQVAANEKIITTETEVNRVVERFEKAAKKLPSMIRTDLMAKLAEAQGELAAAKEKVTFDRYNEAFIAAQKSFRLAHEADTLLTLAPYLFITAE